MSIDRDGVRTVTDPRAKWIVVVAVAASVLVIVAAFIAISRLPERREDDTIAAEQASARTVVTPPPKASKPEPSSSSPRTPPDVRAVHVDRSAGATGLEEREASDPATEKQPELLARDVIPALTAAGEKEGIAAFPPPGTDPLKSGILVPDDFELPPGYVRHYQNTDDGKQLGAILMFSPDYQFVDQAGKPIPLPENRIVPPEMAPRGLPIRMLELPKGLESDRAR